MFRELTRWRNMIVVVIFLCLIIIAPIVAVFCLFELAEREKIAGFPEGMP